MVISGMTFEKVHVIFFVLFFITDAALLYLAKKEDFQNKYFLFHKKWGFLKVELFKLLAALIIVDDIVNPGLRVRSSLVVIVFYCVIVSKFLIDYISFRRRKMEI